MADSERKSTTVKLSLAALILLIIAMLGLLVYTLSRGGAKPRSPGASAKGASAPELPADAGTVALPEFTRLPDPNAPFIHQRHDFPPDTPQRLGPKIGANLFDLETIQDMVRRGHEEGSEIAKVRGYPLTLKQREAGRKVLQSFFDEITPIIDDLLDDKLSLAEGLLVIQPRRAKLNVDLQESLELSDTEVYELWPQLGDLRNANWEMDAGGPRRSHAGDPVPGYDDDE